MTLYIILVALLIIVILVFIALNNLSKLKELMNTIDICSGKLEETLEEKKELLTKLSEETKNKDLIKLINIKDNLDIFELEKSLFDTKWGLNKLIANKKLKVKKDASIILTNLNKIEDDIEGLKDYYNSKAITYNEKYFKKPFNIIYKLLKYEQKKTFTIRKIDDYEIMKD